MTANDRLPARPRNPRRRVGESYRDCVDRLAGELQAAELDRDRLAAQRAAVLHLHRAETYFSGVPSCSTCVDGHEAPVAYPCETAEALGATR